ncbi:LOW QUALITY PROTEIN: 3 beta-hydroxysteroid dehydrogenase type 7-like [Heptranchias perlo]|uniref:LOW QUALITY PROTEIN: 3 beta-hydroxysteroid dehydrogenase type 7-like n=1 Tax=Heptranchias perlo TaxID=212740 RepID=UPI003559BC9C
MSGVPGQVYLVTGGCGFLGRHLVKMLVERREGISEIRVFDLHLAGELETLSTDTVTVTLIQGDITDLPPVLRASEGVDSILHLASVIDFSGAIADSIIMAVNVQGTCHVIEACLHHGIQYLVYTSSMEVVGPNPKGQSFYRGDEETSYNTCHKAAYSRSKAIAERLVIEANGKQVAGGRTLYTCALRPMGIYGEGLGLLTTMLREASRLGGRLPRLAPATVQHGHVYVGNVVWMHVLAARALQETPEKLGGQVYYCYDGSPDKSHLDFKMEFLAPCGVRLIARGRRLLPAFLVYLLACLFELLRFALRPFCAFAPFLNRTTLAVASTTFTVRTDKAARHFGYRPLFSWEESKARTVRWLQGVQQQATRRGRF